MAPGVGTAIDQDGSGVRLWRGLLSDGTVRESPFHSFFKCHPFYRRGGGGLAGGNTPGQSGADVAEPVVPPWHGMRMDEG